MAVVAQEVVVAEQWAEKLLTTGLMRVVDADEAKKMTGATCEPWSFGVAYRCTYKVRPEDLKEDEEPWCDPVSMTPLPMQDGEVWRVKLIVGNWCSVESNTGYPIFTPWSDQPKYLNKKGAPAALMFDPTILRPEVCRQRPGFTAIPEGEKKAIHLVIAGWPAFSIPGKDNWSSRAERGRRVMSAANMAAKPLDPGIADTIREEEVQYVVIADDADYLDKPEVITAQAEFAVELAGVLPRQPDEVLPVSFLLLPRGPKGADDWLVANPRGSLSDWVISFNTESVDLLKQALDKADERAMAIVQLMLELERARRARGKNVSATPEEVVRDQVKALKLVHEEDLLAALKAGHQGALARLRPKLFKHFSDNYLYAKCGGGSVFKKVTESKATVVTREPRTDAPPLQHEIWFWANTDRGLDLPPPVTKKLFEEWRQRQEPVDANTFMPCGFATDNRIVYQLLPEPTAGPMPANEEFLSRPGFDRECMLTWLGSLFDFDNPSRAILWLSGGGNDGKSFYLSYVASLFGAAAYKLDDSFKPENKHASANLEEEQELQSGEPR